MRIVLKERASFGPGFHLYYSSRRHIPAGLELLIDIVRELQPLRKLNIQLYQHVVVKQKAQCIETTHFSDRHFWHGGYDKAGFR